MTADITHSRDGRHDRDRAIAELRERLPERLAPLARLAYNYRWSWLPDGPTLFETIDSLHWQRSGGNPRYVIEAVPPRRLRQLAEQPAFVARVERLAARLDADLARPQAATPIEPAHPVAYFCSEYGLHASLPLYSGGLGVLAGDTLKAASDLGLPMIAVGLMYDQGYFHQRLDATGWQIEYWTSTDFERLPAVLVTNGEEEPVTVTVVVYGRTVRLQIWRVDVGRVPLFLLDSDRDDNDAIDRWITARLYIGDRRTRLAQYAVLGIGGVRALAALGIHPARYHLNEGHAVFGSLERLRVRLAAGQAFDDALVAVRQETIFTTHTPIAAGNEGYSSEEIEAVLGDFVGRVGVSRATLYRFGRVIPDHEHEPVSITPLALRTSGAANGVSRRHGEVSRAMWKSLWPERAEADVPIGHVTNGVHVFTWMAPPMQALFDRHLGAEWRTRAANLEFWEQAIDTIPDAELWEARCTLRATLIDLVRQQSVRDRLARGEPLQYVEAAARVFDPDVLTIGFARRVAMYKRLYLVRRLLDRGLVQLFTDAAHAVQFVAAGKAHPSDEEAKATLRDGFQVKAEAILGQRMAFLEDYDLRLAHQIVAGADVWLNMPRPPLEASGTSGMKAGLNGSLNLSVLDGWWIEGFDGENGWGIESPNASAEEQDEHDAQALFDLLEQEVIPLFYDRDPDGLPRRWLARMKRSLRTIIPRFSAERMVRDYVGDLYTRP